MLVIIVIMGGEPCSEGNWNISAAVAKYKIYPRCVVVIMMVVVM